MNRVRNAGGSVSTVKVLAADKLLSSLQNTGFYTPGSTSSIIRWILLIGGCDGFSGCNVPIVDVHGFGNSTLNNYVSGDWNSSGLAGNTSTKYIDTKYNMSTGGFSTSAGFFLFWDTSVTKPFPGYAAIGTNVTNVWTMYWSGNQSGDFGSLWGGAGNTETFVTYPLTTGLTGCLRTSSTTFTRRSDSYSSIIASSTGTGVDSNTLYLGARNEPGGPANYHADRYLLALAGSSITSSGFDIINGIFKTYKTGIGL
jgi:hypothetical protein